MYKKMLSKSGNMAQKVEHLLCKLKGCEFKPQKIKGGSVSHEFTSVLGKKCEKFFDRLPGTIANHILLHFYCVILLQKS
jgi:hypothetical protein